MFCCRGELLSVRGQAKGWSWCWGDCRTVSRGVAWCWCDWLCDWRLVAVAIEIDVGIEGCYWVAGSWGRRSVLQSTKTLFYMIAMPCEDEAIATIPLSLIGLASGRTVPTMQSKDAGRTLGARHILSDAQQIDTNKTIGRTRQHAMEMKPTAVCQWGASVWADWINTIHFGPKTV